MPTVRRKSPTIAPVSLKLEDDSPLDHHARLAVVVAAAAKSQAGGGAVRLHIRQLLANKPDAFLIGRGESHRPSGTARAIKQVRRAVLYRAARTDVFGPTGNTDIVVDRVARQDRAAIGRGVMAEAERRALSYIGVLEIGRDRPRRVAVGVDQIDDVAVVLRERGGEGRFEGGAEIAAAGYGQSVDLVDLPGGRTGNPVIVLRIEAVIQRHREGDRPKRVVSLDAAADCRLLVPQQPALDVHVLKGEGVFGADQGGQFADLERELVGRRELAVGHRYRVEEVAGAALDADIRGAHG